MADNFFNVIIKGVDSTDEMIRTCQRTGLRYRLVSPYVAGTQRLKDGVNPNELLHPQHNRASRRPLQKGKPDRVRDHINDDPHWCRVVMAELQIAKQAKVLRKKLIRIVLKYSDVPPVGLDKMDISDLNMLAGLLVQDSRK